MFAHLLMPAIVLAMNSLVAQQADLRFGHSQVEQLICDRPELGTIINREPALRALLESSFAGELIGQRVYWDCREPVSGRPSEKIPRYLEYPDLVRVSNRSSISAVDKCAMLILELQNVRSGRNLAALSRMAVQKQISRNDFARSCVRLEFESAKRTQEFFRKHPITELGSEDTQHYRSIMALSEDFSEYLRWLNGPDSKKDNILNYYAQQYDELLSTPAH
jgi:hypothetical protein